MLSLVVNFKQPSLRTHDPLEDCGSDELSNLSSMQRPLVSQAPSRKKSLEDLQKARVLRWREQNACCCRAANRVEFRALLGRVSACRAEGRRRFARVHPSCPLTLIFERRRVGIGPHAVGCYGTKTICSEGATA